MTKHIKRKVLFFLPSGVGGAERMTITIAKMLSIELFDVKFIIVSDKYGDIINFIPSSYPYCLLKIRNIFDFATIRLYRMIKNERPDVVFCSLIYLSARVIIASKFVKGIKIIVRNNIGLYRLSKFNYWLCRVTYPKADVIIAQQEEMREEIVNLLNVNPQKVVTLQNPIDIKSIRLKASEQSPYKEDNVIRYVWAGRISYEKGHDVLIKAFAKVRQRLHNARLYILGKYSTQNSYYQSLVLLRKELSLESEIEFVGFDANPYRWEKYCNCFVQPSRVEGLPNALIEAMYLGVPVVATRCVPVVDRIVKDGYNGFIVNPDSVDELAEAMLKAITLKNFMMTYKSATEDDFRKLFIK